MSTIETLNLAQNNRLTSLESMVGTIGSIVDTNRRHANGGVAAAMALGGAMVVPDSNVSLSFNLATYRGEQGFSGTLIGKVAEKIYISGGVAGSTVKGSTGGRVGVTFGF